MKLTEKQKRFADEYIIHGNATQAAINAGYSNKTAKETGYENLTKPHISEYIAKRIEKIENDKLMSVEEALVISSDIARGNDIESISKHYDNLKGEYTKDVVYTFTPDLEARQKAIEHILRVNGVINGKLALEKLQKEIELLAKKIEQLDKTDETSTENNLADALIKLAGGNSDD
ncbi:terminase small subunit [Macrococcoides caseolyticum]|uniref:terminase small subunit n=1 Tax=Macrococcoides caseolyticum TaxID=69966 RepID=UPI000C32DCEF|nr:terminase small subunit [Macrococcus caseolyticus]PKE72975.1 terminase small subunit [Macrococcus caseolyticus]